MARCLQGSITLYLVDPPIDKHTHTSAIYTGRGGGGRIEHYPSTETMEGEHGNTVDGNLEKTKRRAYGNVKRQKTVGKQMTSWYANRNNGDNRELLAS